MKIQTNFREKIIVKLYNLQHKLRSSIHELKHITIELTKRCNLQCKHCYMESVLKIPKDELTLKEIKQIADQIKQSFGSKIAIGFTGGEVFMRKDFFEILDYFHKLDFRFSLVTNGILLSEKKLQKLKKYRLTIAISLDGLEKNHNTLRNSDCFAKIMLNLEKFHTLGLKLPLVKTVVTQKNLLELEKMSNFLCEKGVREWQIFTMKPNGRGMLNSDLILDKKGRIILENKIKELQKQKRVKIIFDEWLNQKIQKYCSCGISSFAILYNGDIVHCIDTPRKKRFIEGNIRYGKIQDVWKNRFQKYRKKGYVCVNKNINL